MTNETSAANTRVVLIFGGRSAEHEVSLLSARNILHALDRSKFDPFLIGIDKQGRWRREFAATLEAAAGNPRGVRLDDRAAVVDASILRPDDVVFPVLHGTYGEDGTIQGLLELADVAYVGAGVLGSSVAMDKDVTKRLLRDAGIPIVDYAVVTAHEFARDPERCLAKAADLGFPLFCKPANAGSSIGVSRVVRPADLPAALLHDLGHVFQSGEHLIHLINDLLDLSRLEENRLNPVSSLSTRFRSRNARFAV